MYLIIDKADDYIEETNRSQYLTFASTDKNEEALTKYTEVWDKTKYLIKTITDCEAAEYEKDFMQIKVDSDGNLSLNKTLKLHMLTVIVRFFFEEDGE